METVTLESDAMNTKQSTYQILNAISEVTTTFVASDRENTDPFHTCNLCTKALCVSVACAKTTV